MTTSRFIRLNHAQVLKNYLFPVENGEESGKICKVLELGSGSGQHAVMFCERHPRTLLWQPSDCSQRCIDSVDRRAELCSVKREESAGSGKAEVAMMILLYFRTF